MEEQTDEMTGDLGPTQDAKLIFADSLKDSAPFFFFLKLSLGWSLFAQMHTCAF